MTIAMQLREEGLKEGLQKGLQKGRSEGLKPGKIETQKETVIKLFTKADFTVNQIVEYLDLDRKFVKNILKETGLI